MSKESKINFSEFFQSCADEIKNLKSAKDLPSHYLDHGLGKKADSPDEIIKIYQWIMDNKKILTEKVSAAANSEAKAVQWAKEETKLLITIYILIETDGNIILVFDKNSKFLEDHKESETKEKIIAIGGTSKIRKSVAFNRGNLEAWVTSAPKDKILQIEINHRVRERRLAKKAFPNPYLLPTYYSENYKFKKLPHDDYEYQAKIATLSPCKSTNLYQFLRNPYPTHFSLGNMLWIIFSLLSGAAGLHQNGLFHRDLKPENILIDPGPEEKDSETWHAFIADFNSMTDNCNAGYAGTPHYTPFDHPFMASNLSTIMKLPRKGDEIKILNLLNGQYSDSYSSNTFYFGRFSSLDEARKRLPTLRWFFKYFALNPRTTSLETSRKVSKEYDAWAISAITVEMIEKWNQEKNSDKESPEILKILLNLAENCLTKLEKHRPDCAKLLDYFLIEINDIMVDVETPLELKNDISKVFAIQSKKLKVENPLNVFYDKLINYQKNIILELDEEQKSLKKALNSFKRDFQTKKVKENAVRNLLKIYAGEKHITLDVHELKACFNSKLGNIILSCWKIIRKGYPALYEQLKYEKAQSDQRGKFLYRSSDPVKEPTKSDNFKARPQPYRQR